MRPLPIAAAIAAIATPALAQTPVGEVVVTAPRLPTGVDLVTGLRTVERAEIEARQATFASEVLATIPGVSVFRRGIGGLTTVRLRGAEADKTLVLIDGVPVNDPADPSGAFDFSSLQMGDIERVEVLSGPQGSLWGSDAIGGVIAFTSREPDGWRAEIDGGSYGTVRGLLSGGLRSQDHALGATLAGYRSDGLSKAASGTEDDGFETFTGTVTGRARLTEAVELDGKLRYTWSDVEIDGFAPPTFTLADTDERNRSRAWSGFGRLTAQALGLTHRLSFSASDLTRDNIGPFPARYTADRAVWRWTGERGGPDDAFAFVLGAERADADVDLAGRAVADLSTSALFAVGRGRAGLVTATASLRYDDP
ncbi:MAG: TonB-dependent receptor plug domain-containing protein, partial [Phenylobacterium sp.]